MKQTNRYQWFCGMEWVKFFNYYQWIDSFFNEMIISGDTSVGLSPIRNLLIELLGPNTYVKSIRIGRNTAEDFQSGYFVHPNKQIKDVCSQIASDPKLQNGYNGIGFSQGAQFL